MQERLSIPSSRRYMGFTTLRKFNSHQMLQSLQLLVLHSILFSHYQLLLPSPDECALQNRPLLGMFLPGINVILDSFCYIETFVLLSGVRQTRAPQTTSITFGMVYPRTKKRYVNPRVYLCRSATTTY